MSFEQTGTVDWLSLSSQAISVVGRLSQGGVDEYTVKIAQAFGKHFRFLDSYLDPIEKKLVTSKRYGCRNNFLFFGTGVSTIPRLFGQTREGVAYAALVIALSSTFDYSYTARVLVEMARTVCAAMQAAVPSISQFEALSKELAAAAADEGLGEQLFHLNSLQLRASRPSMHGGEKITSYDGRNMVPEAAQMATVILAISALASDQVIIIKTKVPYASWIVVFADRVLGHRVIYRMNSRVIWQSSVVRPHRGTVIIQHGRRHGGTEEGISGENGMQIMHQANLRLNISRIEPTALAGVGVPLGTAVKYLVGVDHQRPVRRRFYAISQRQYSDRIDARLAATVQILFRLRGARLGNHNRFCDYDQLDRTFRPEFTNHEVFNPSPEEVLEKCRMMYPDTALSLTDMNQELEDSNEWTICCTDILTGSDACRIRDRWIFFWIYLLKDMKTKSKVPSNPTDIVEKFQKSSVSALFRIMLALLFIRLDCSSGILINERALRTLMGLHSRLPYSIEIWAKHASTACALPPSNPELCGPGCRARPRVLFISYFQLLKDIFFLLHGICTPTSRYERGGFYDDSWEVAVAGAGRYTVMGIVEEPFQNLPSALMVNHGYGGIFVNEKCVERLTSFEEMVDHQQGQLAGFTVFRHPSDIDIDPEILEEHEQGTVVDAFSDFPLPETNLDKLDFTHKLIVHETSEKTYITWSITARVDIDFPVDARISPYSAVRNLLGHEHCKESLDRNLTRRLKPSWCRPQNPGTSFTILNLESYLLKKAKPENNIERTIVMARNDPARAMLALCHTGLPDIIIRHDSRTMSLQESMNKILNSPRSWGTIVVVA